MKKITLFLLVFSIASDADLSVAEIENMVTKIHKKRAGIKLKTLELTKEPFVRFEAENNVTTLVIPNKKRVNDVTLILHAVLNNKAYINNSWVRVDDTVMGYKLMFIGKRGVVLRNENHIKKLFLKKDKNNLIQLEERY